MSLITGHVLIVHSSVTTEIKSKLNKMKDTKFVTLQLPLGFHELSCYKDDVFVSWSSTHFISIIECPLD